MATQDNELQKALRYYLNENPGGEQKIADEFEVAESTVNRWLRGVATPHPLIVRQIIDFTKRMAKTRMTYGPGYITCHTDVEPKTLKEVVWLARHNFSKIPFDKIEIRADQGKDGGTLTLETRASMRRK